MINKKLKNKKFIIEHSMAISSLEAGHGRGPGVRLGYEPVLPGFGGVGPQPPVHRLIVQIRINPVAPAYCQVVRRLCLVIVKHHQFGAVVPQIVRTGRR